MQLLPLDDDLARHRDADRAADVAHHVEHARGRTELRLLDPSTAITDSAITTSDCPIPRTTSDGTITFDAASAVR